MKKFVKPLITVLLVAALLVPTVAMLVSNAATSFTVELAFNNLFVFENWATNTLSTTLVKEATPISGNNPSEGGTLAIDISNGKITMTKDDLSINNLYTACSMSKNPTENIGYYNANIKANTEYEFSYNLSGTTTAFVPYIFFFDSSNSFIDNVYFYDTEAGTKRYKFTTPANTSHIQIRFGINDTTTSHPGVSSVNAVIDTIKISEVVPPPQTGNLFRFDDWADTPSSQIATGNATMTTDKVNNTFTITRTSGDTEIYNAFSSSANPADNAGLYSIKVQPDTEYSLTYTTYNTTEAALDTFFPLIFVFDEENKYIDGQMIQGSCNANIDKSESSVDRPYTFRYDFTTPSNAGRVQIRFTFQDKTASTTVSVKNIVFCEAALVSQNNLFDYDKWLSTAGTENGGISVLHQNGTLATNAEDRSIAITTNSNPDSVTLTYVDFGTIDKGYAIPVEPGKTYTITYNLDFGSCIYITAFTQVRIFTAWYNSAKEFKGYANYFPANIANKGENTISFTVPANMYYIELAFANYYPVTEGVDISKSSTTVINNVEIYETDISAYDLFEETGVKPVDPHRQAFTYKGNGETYGTLPVPNEIPDNYVFAGWYTEPDGKGTRIASDTEIIPQSMTVYPKFEPAVDTLTVKTPPAKTTYTVGEKINITGLVLEATIDDGTGADGSISTLTINSGYYITPEYAQATAGTQTITVHYGGKTATFTVTVSDGDDKNIVVNDTTHAVKVANNNYTINYQAPTPFNRYEMTYFSDSYVKGEIVMDGVTEVFFLEPSNNGAFASYIDSFLRGVSHYNVDSIKFTCLDKEFGNFELLSVTTIAATIPSNPTQYYENAETGYKVGIDLSFGGVVSEVYDLNNPVESRVYTIDGKNVTKVDYAERLDADYGTGYISRSTENINLINKFDRGRYLQQSYYGTSQKPFETGNYNGNPWPYNPVQGGNLVVYDANGNAIKGNEASKVIDYRITNEQIYIKTRPLDWGKNSVDYPDSYVTDSYMEAWYVFEDGMIKTYCRFVDYSGYPAHTRDQELPAVYIIEPLNHFVYNPVADGSEWTTTNYTKIEEPDFWGVLPEYNALLETPVDPTVDCYENWAAFTASDNANSFGVGVYSAGVTDFHYGCFYPKYNETEAKNGNLVATENRHAVTTDPATENPTSYISPVDDMTFESYKPIEYSYYLTTGTADDIYTDFKNIAKKESQADLDKPKIAVPETVYMTPVDGASKVGQYYVNNLLDTSNSYNIVTEAERDAGMYLGLHIKNGATFSVKVTNATDPSNDIFLCNTSGSEISESTRLSFDATDTFTNNTTYGLRFSGAGLQPGEKATAKWEITVYLDDGTTETYTAYTVMYAPGRTVGAVAEARQVAASQNEISSWITGANGVDHSIWAPLGSLKGDFKGAGYFTNDPLYNENPPTGGSGGNATDYIEEQITGVDVDNNVYNENNYVMQTATNDHDSSRARSYLGLLTVDKSRYTNTNQIPNLEIGYDALRIGSYEKNSIGKYTTYYTLGTESSYTTTSLSEAPSGWTVHSNYTDLYSVSGVTIPYRERVIPSFDVSTIDGKYIHALNQAKADQTINTNQYSTAGTSVLCSVTDKSALRDTVMDGYGLKKEDYSEDSYNKFLEELEKAGTVLGDPSASQDEIDQANKELTDAIEKMTEVYYSLKYDNLFSVYEFSQYSNSMTVVGDKGTVSYNAGALTVVNDTITGGEAYTQYGTAEGNYLIDLKPNTEYVFEYTSETTLKAQAFMFFYNSSGGAGDVPTNMSIKVNDGNWSSKSESNAWWGNYQNSAGTNHYTIKFTTGANTTKAGFRFGNTSNDPVTSTFSNIKLVDAAHYYEDATYSKTEDVYKKYASYGTLVTPVRPGYTFGGWVDATNKAVTGSDIATEHKSIYSVWNENSYTIVYNSNGGSGSIASQTIKYTEEVDLASSGFTKSGSELLGWSTDSAATSVQYQLGETVSKLAEVNGSTVTLYAVWGESWVNVTFDNLFDYNAFNISTSKLTVNEKTDTGFKVTSTGSDANTGFSYAIDIEPGKSYVLTADITTFTPSANNAYDVYVQALNASQSGDSSFTAGSGVGVESNVYMVKHGTSAGKVSLSFTAGATTEYVKIRFDANDSGSVLAVNNIRISEDTGIEVSPVNKKVRSQTAYGTLPTPTREGYTFKGWYNGDTQVTETTVLTQTSTVYLKSKWQLANTALTADTAVIDFSTPITIDAVANDTIFTDAATVYGATASIVGVSTDGDAYTSTANGKYGIFKVENGNIVYTPTSVVNGIETVYYHTQLDKGDSTVVKSQITVAPASNVLYEENVFTVTGTGRDWNRDGTTATVNQDASTVNDVYGYDSNTAGYKQLSNYSNGSALKVTVSETYKRSKNIKFDFTGEGFDLNGACGLNTGVLVVTLRDNDYKNDKGEKVGKMVKSYIVDTYYSDLDDEGIDRYSNTLYQVPLISENGLEHSNYTVQIVASYLPSMSGAINNRLSTQAVDDMPVGTASYTDNDSLREALAEAGLEHVLDAESVEVIWFDENSIFNGGEGVNTFEEGVVHTQGPSDLLNIIDSVRVYNPLEDGNSYYISSETNAQYYNVIDNLVNVKDGNIITPDNGGNFAYVSGNDANEISVEKYAEIGPKDELYLSKASFVDNKAVTFTINGFDKNSMKVMVSLRAASGIPTAKFGGSQFAVKSNTEMYYDITNYIDEDGTVTIQNVTEKTLLSVGTLKITSEAIETASLSTEFNLMTARTMMMAPAEDVEPNVPDTEPEEPVIPEEPSEDDSSSECWLVRFFNWLISMFTKFIDFIKGILSL